MLTLAIPPPSHMLTASGKLHLSRAVQRLAKLAQSIRETTNELLHLLTRDDERRGHHVSERPAASPLVRRLPAVEKRSGGRSNRVQRYELY